MIEHYNEDNLKVMAKLPDESIDIICIDPPYLYLKNQKLERVFDENIFFSECKRLLTPDGFIILFGRGVSLCRWTLILDNLNFVFKEEIVWDKRRITSAVTALGRRHEMIYIFSKGKGVINKTKVPFFEKYKYEPEKISRTVERLATTFGNRETFDLLKKYYESDIKEYKKSKDSKFNVTRNADTNINQNRTISFACSLEEGIKEQSIIQQSGDHYDTIHPTQKPVNLLIRILNLVLPKHKNKITIADWFGGSFSTMEAVVNIACLYPETEFKGITTEIDNEYYENGVNRIERFLSIPKQINLFK